MKNFILFLLLIITSLNLSAQIQFNQVPAPPPAPQLIADFKDVRDGSVAFADVDNDNDLDVLITGNNSSSSAIPISVLYLNDGNGNFTEKSGTPFVNVSAGSIAFADVDGDNDLDVLITGADSSNQPTTKLYTNDGNGNFTEVVGATFDNVRLSSIAFADVDGDNDQDVLITGINSSNQRIAKLYSNNGVGIFSEVAATPFEGVIYGSVAFADIDSDNDQDVLITGENASPQFIAKLYTNNGSGTFTEAPGTPFDGVWQGSIAFADIDTDNDQDVLITGRNNSSQIITKLYTNNGSGAFTEVTGTPFTGVWRSDVAFADIDADDDLDVLITGNSIAKLYTNDGSGAFTEVIGTPFDAVDSSSIAFADVDGDNDQDVLITGRNNSSQNISKLFINDSNGNFTEVIKSPFRQVSSGSVSYADIDGDNDLDLLLVGGQPRLYLNDGIGRYGSVSILSFNNFTFPSSAFADVDGDNDMDIMVMGRTGFNEWSTKLYLNDGSGNFTEDTNNSFSAFESGIIKFADIDNDNDMDVYLTGNSFGNSNKALYLNDGNGNFSFSNSPFTAVDGGSIEFYDYDNDNDLDVLITGYRRLFGNTTYIAELYENSGSGNFTFVSGTPFEGVGDSSTSIADIDNDNDLDILITGINGSGQIISKIYTYNSSSGYSELLGTGLSDLWRGSAAFTDADSDGDPDVLITGYNSSNQVLTEFYTNNGSGVFTLVPDLPFFDTAFSALAFFDIDNDADEDLILTGLTAVSTSKTRLYRNTSFELNWTGNVNDLWTEAGNWSDNTLPGTTSKAIIADVANQPRIEAADQIEVSDVILRANTSLEVLGVLKVNRDIINNGQITFKSDASSTGQLDEFSGTFSGTGSVTVERFIPASNRAFRFLSTPVTSSGTILDNWQQGGLNPGDDGYEANLGTHITGDAAGNNGFDATQSGNPSMFGYNNGNYTDILNTDNTSLIAGEAYTIFIRGDRTAANLSATPPSAQETTLRTTGLGTDFRTGQVTLNTSSTPQLSNTTGEYNLIANPYQSIVDLCAVDRTNLSNTVWVRNVASGTNGAWVSLDIDDTANAAGLCDPNAPPAPTSGSSQFIQPGSAFFIETTAVSPSITFEEADKATDASQPLDIVFNETTMFYVNARLYLSSELQNGDIERDAFGLRFDDQFTTSGGEEDADKFTNPDENIGIVNNGLKYIDKQSMPSIGHSIQLETTGYTGSTYSLVFTMANLPENMAVFIYDAYLGTQTELSDGFVFDFMVDASIPESIASDRFSLVFDNTTLSTTDNAFGYNFSLYPNPAHNGRFYVTTPGLTGVAQVTLTNVLGQQVYVQQLDIQNQEVQIHAESLSSGVYMLNLSQGEQSFSTKVIIE